MMNDFTLHPQFTDGSLFADDGHDDLEAIIHETASKFLELENTAVEALCLAYLVRMGDDPITDWMVVRQRSEDGLTLKVWLHRKEDALPSPTPGKYVPKYDPSLVSIRG